jgi:hypothetical protein
VSPDVKIESFSNNVEVLQENVAVVYEDKERERERESSFSRVSIGT